jgi:hypothetical protein
MLERICGLLFLLHFLGCSDSNKTFIPEKPDPPPTQAEGILKPPPATADGKTRKQP